MSDEIFEFELEAVKPAETRSVSNRANHLGGFVDLSTLKATSEDGLFTNTTTTATITFAGVAVQHRLPEPVCAGADLSAPTPPMLLNDGNIYSWVVNQGGGARSSATYQAFDTCAVPSAEWLAARASCRCERTPAGDGFAVVCN